MGSREPIFKDLNPDDPDHEATIVESLCMNCEQNGQTRLLLTKIPFYKEVILMSFSCDKCGFENNEIQSGAALNERGVKIVLRVQNSDDLNRQVVKSDYTSVKIVELDFEIPSKSQKGEVTTVEGIVDRSIAGLEQDQIVRRIQHPDVAAQIDDFIGKLRELKHRPFTIILEDISGNSFVQNPNAPQLDSQCTTTHFVRNKAQNHELGIFTQQEVTGVEPAKPDPLNLNEAFTLENWQSEVLQFPTNCTNCGAACETNMKLTNIPHFKEVVIMATSCDTCGHRTNEVKSGGGVEPLGLHIEVDVRRKEDMTRDVLKSETCELRIPELDLDVGGHALGGRFTTVEGVIAAMRDQLCDPKHSHVFGDSSDDVTRKRFQDFIARFEDVLQLKLPVTLVLRDPAGNSFVQSAVDEGETDERLRVTKFERTFEENEDLGLNDIKTEGY